MELNRSLESSLKYLHHASVAELALSEKVKKKFR